MTEMMGVGAGLVGDVAFPFRFFFLREEDVAATGDDGASLVVGGGISGTVTLAFEADG